MERKLTFVEPKTEKSRRTVIIPGVVLERLKDHRLRQFEERHSQIAVTSDLYGHMFQELRQEVADRMDAILGPTR